MNVDEIWGVLHDVLATLEMGLLPAVLVIPDFSLKAERCIVPVTAQYRAHASLHHKTHMYPLAVENITSPFMLNSKSYRESKS